MFCYNCFNTVQMTGICPCCGFDPSHAEEMYPNALPYGTPVGGRYITGRVLGKGGFGMTYKAYEPGRGRLVTIKEYYPEGIAYRADKIHILPYPGAKTEHFKYGIRAFLDEARALASFNSYSNIVSVHAYCEENGTAYFAMEYLNGVNLKELIERIGRPLSWSEAMFFLIPVINVLSAVHAAGMIHRDIKPDNIMVTADSGAKLIDFGSAKMSFGEMSHSLKIVLTPGFAPKEQYSSTEPQGAFTDVYSMAATIYYAVTGKVPQDSVDRRENDELIPPRAFVTDMPPAAQDVLLKALAVSAGMRYQSMEEFGTALRETAGMPYGHSGDYIVSWLRSVTENNKEPLVPAEEKPPVDEDNEPGEKEDEGSEKPDEKQTDKQELRQPERERVSWVVPTVIVLCSAAAVFLIISIIMMTNKSSVSFVEKDPRMTEEAMTVNASVTEAEAGIFAFSAEPATSTLVTGMDEYTDDDPRESGLGTVSIVTGNETPEQVNDMSYTDTHGARGKYTGELMGGRPHGKGVFVYSEDGGTAVYEGDWVNGIRSGTGEKTWTSDEGSTGSIEFYLYRGEFANDAENGKGKYTWKRKSGNTEVYEGEVSDGRIDGSGTYTWDIALGNFYFAQYVGEFTDGHITGRAVKNWKGRDGLEVVEDGVFTDNILSGIGKKTWRYPDGEEDVYEGDFVKGTRTGSGKLTKNGPDGKKEVYEGGFKDNKKHGKGTETIYNTDGVIEEYSGKYNSDERSGIFTVTITMADGTKEVSEINYEI
ncbi:MAG: protein kinase [Ruminiclostridium sp.]|nr:protein kinase [Ruminiclostridium sp.]